MIIGDIVYIGNEKNSYRRIYNRLWVGNDVSCLTGRKDFETDPRMGRDAEKINLDDGTWSIIHACKYPCHQDAVGYEKGISPTHPNYLFLEREHDLYLNLIDPPKPLFKLESFVKFLEFASREYKTGRNILIHCNMGLSRSTSLTLVFMAKVLGVISNSSYRDAVNDYKMFDELHTPGAGIDTFLHLNWHKLGAF